MYILFGAGEYGQKSLKLIGREKVAFFVDNDAGKSNSTINGVQCFLPESKIQELLSTTVLITVSKDHEGEVVEQLRMLGVKDYLSVNGRLYHNQEEYFNAKMLYSAFISDESRQFWDKQTEWTTRKAYPLQYDNERKLILDYFLSRLVSRPVVADLGCASGGWTMEIAPYCRMVEGFDYSSMLISNAKKNNHFDNVSFSRCNLMEIEFDKEYDGMMLLGVLMYFFDERAVLEVLKRIRRALRKGGVLVTKETLNISEMQSIFYYAPISGYSAWYMTQNTYYSLFLRAGFTLIDDLLLDVRPIESDGVGFISRGTVWKAN